MVGGAGRGGVWKGVGAVIGGRGGKGRGLKGVGAVIGGRGCRGREKRRGGGDWWKGVEGSGCGRGWER